MKLQIYNYLHKAYMTVQSRLYNIRQKGKPNYKQRLWQAAYSATRANSVCLPYGQQALGRSSLSELI